MQKYVIIFVLFSLFSLACKKKNITAEQCQTLQAECNKACEQDPASKDLCLSICKPVYDSCLKGEINLSDFETGGFTSGNTLCDYDSPAYNACYTECTQATGLDNFCTICCVGTESNCDAKICIAKNNG